MNAGSRMYEAGAVCALAPLAPIVKSAAASEKMQKDNLIGLLLPCWRLSLSSIDPAGFYRIGSRPGMCALIEPASPT
jgi:hypothetical protein